jgi:hypothetical protein
VVDRCSQVLALFTQYKLLFGAGGGAKTPQPPRGISHVTGRGFIKWTSTF